VDRATGKAELLVGMFVRGIESFSTGADGNAHMIHGEDDDAARSFTSTQMDVSE
jgi:hypothetical protein